MTSTADNYIDPDLDEDEGEDSEEDFKNLRAKARKASKIEQENLRLRRENAFMKAGLPLDDPKMGYFVKGYEGDLDPDAIRRAAIEAGFIAAPAQDQDPRIAEAQQGQAAVMALSAGAETGFDDQSSLYQMEQAYAEGGIEGLSAVTQQYGVTFLPDTL